MLSIGEFSNICQVSAKTLRYYAEIGLILPEQVNPDNGYRYYSVKQLETMLFINRLKSYHFSLEEIKLMIDTDERQDEKLYDALARKKSELQKHIDESLGSLAQLNNDLATLKQGKSIMSYMEEIDISLTEIPTMYLISSRKMVLKNAFEEEYASTFSKLFRRINEKHLTVSAPPMVLFHGDEFTPFGLDTEFAVPVKEYATGTRSFSPKLCIKTTLQGSYLGLPSIYARQREWTETQGYENTGALFEVYVTDPSQVTSENDLITEIFYPVRKTTGQFKKTDEEC